MEVGAKICLICGVNSNKVAKHDRYNHVPIGKKDKLDLSGSDSDSNSKSRNSKSKKKAPPPKPVRAAVDRGSSRQTRNKNPKTFAASLCKAMDLPDTPDDPFLQIFSNADYCNDCMAKVKDIHNCQMELEKIQKRLSEYRIDIELDMSKHLQKIPFCKSMLRTDVFDRYRVELDLILDFHGTEKKKNSVDEAAEENETEAASKRPKRQAAVDSSAKLKRKLEENELEDAGDEVAMKVSKQETESEFAVEESELEVSQTNGTKKEDVEGATEEVPPAGELSEETLKVEAKPVPVRERVKKDPNLKCPHCPIPRYFNIPESLEEHVAKAHVERRKHVCDICERRFHSVKEMQKHRAQVHDVAESAAGWTCGFCDQEFSQKRYLEDHLDRHQEAKPLNCMYCGGTFTKKDSLQKAFQIYKGETVEPCKKCGRNLNLKDYLEHNRKLKEK